MRIAAPASLWWLVATAGAAALLPAWRQRPLLAAPALLATIPWWPVPLPAAALIWTGPVAWLAVGLALFAGTAGSWPARALGRAFPSKAGPPWRAAAWAGAATLLVLLAAGWSLAPNLPGGDEPHYLVITQSLLLDGDLRIENNHARRDYAAYFSGPLAPDYLARGRDGEIYSIHAPGTAVFVLPAFALFGYRGAQGTIALAAALTAALIWYLGWLATRSRGAAWFAWAAVAGSATFLVQGVTIFPDGPGALAVAAALVCLARLDESARGTPRALDLAASCGLAALPWLHTRFVVLAVGLGGLILWRLVGRPRGDDAAPSPDGEPVPRAWGRAATFLIVPAVSAAAWFLYFQRLYGTPNPAAPYGTGDAGMRLAYAPGALVALFFDEQFGLLTYAPVLAAAFVGLALGRARRDQTVRPLRGGLVVGLVYLTIVGMYWMWWAGVPASPARFAAAMLPTLAAPAAVAWHRGGPFARAVWLLLAVLSVSAAALILGIDHGALAWNLRGPAAAWAARLGPLVDLARAWPSFFYDLTPGDARTEMHFVLHVLLWAGTFALIAATCAWIGRRRALTARSAALMAVAWCAAGLTIAASLGWWFDGVRGLKPLPSQAAILRAVARRPERPLVAIDRLHLSSAAVRDLHLRLDRVDASNRVAWEPLASVPPGRYQLTVSRRRPVDEVLSIRLGGSPRPFSRIDLNATAARVAIPVALPAGARSLVVALDPDTPPGSRTIDIEPLALDRSGGPLASDLTTEGDRTIYFFDPHVFVEDDGFWVRGEKQAAIAIGANADIAAATIELSNGPRPNQVTFGGAIHQTIAMAPGASATVRVATPADQLTRLTIASATGFRPSEDGRSADTRDLGVRVRIR